jgi:hypothetical protein
MPSDRSQDLKVRDSFQRFLALLRSQKVLAPILTEGVAGREAQSYAHGTTGETVYGDLPLRFRNLTLTEADVPSLEDPANLPGFKIRISKQKRGRLQANSLVSNRYAGRGYGIPGAKKEEHLHTFIAYDEGQLVGTVGVRLDSRQGLAADQLYFEELSALREQGFRMCEFTRLAVDKRVASKPVLAGLFHTAYLYASVMRGTTHAVIEVNPRHVLFYRRALGFEVLGTERLSPRVNAPAVLLCVPFDTIANGLARFAGRSEDPAAGRSLFPYGFAPDEELGVLRRLRSVLER